MIVCFQKHSFGRYLLNTHECARTLVSPGDMTVNKILPLRSLHYKQIIYICQVMLSAMENMKAGLRG